MPEIRMLVKENNGKVVLDFGATPVKYVCFTPAMAQQVAKDIINISTYLIANKMGAEESFERKDVPLNEDNSPNEQ